MVSIDTKKPHRKEGIRVEMYVQRRLNTHYMYGWHETGRPDSGFQYKLKLLALISSIHLIVENEMRAQAIHTKMTF